MHYPISTVLTDSFGRHINYLRLAVTDRCNLRCFYCMPEEGINWTDRKELMTYEEMLHLCRIYIGMGVNKIRITGGEPFVRKDIMPFLADLSALPGLDELTLTTNGVLTAPLVPELKRLGVRSVNLSLDTLDANRFFSITHRDDFDKVIATLHALLAHDIKVKINAVVMEGKNIADLVPLAMLTAELPVGVRFIEEMPFNGTGSHYPTLPWNHVRILEWLQQAFPGMSRKPDAPYSTSANYSIPGHKGDVGIIAAYTRSFCGTCNRIRLTPQGVMQTCLYSGGGINVKDLLRAGQPDEQIANAIREAISHKAKDGHEAEQQRRASGITESMATIGG